MTQDPQQRYTQLTIEEREQIQRLRWEHRSLRYIARAVERNVSTISRELQRNCPATYHRYTPRLAQERALRKRSSRGRTQRLKIPALRAYVAKQLKLGWSPEQISGTSHPAVGEHISHEAIYQYVYHQIHRQGYGYVKPGCEDLRPYLPLRRKRRMRKGARTAQKLARMFSLPSIHDRPTEVLTRTLIGHWEDDLIMSTKDERAQHLKTINELVSGIVFIERVDNATITESNRAVITRLRRVPPPYRKTLTRDRGTENLGYRVIEEVLGMQCYFANPYHSWERGANENLNGLIRRFFPKGTNFATITDDQIRQVEYLINSRPRKRLGWKTPYQVFYELTGVALES